MDGWPSGKALRLRRSDVSENPTHVGSIPAPSSIDRRTRLQKIAGVIVLVVTKAFWLALFFLMLLLGNLPSK